MNWKVMKDDLPEFAIGLEIEFRLPLWSADGIHLGGDVGPYTAWRKGVIKGVGQNATYWVVYEPDGWSPEKNWPLSGIYVHKDNIRRIP